MAYDTVSMTDIFPACIDILKSQLVPIHYATLTEMALNKIGVNKRDVNWNRQIEDVREKLAVAGKSQTFYTGKALGSLIGLKWWFETEQMSLLHPAEPIIIPGSARSGANGAFEALMRDPYFKTKTNTTPERLAAGRATGLVTEAHVVDWFRIKWPEFFIEPDNYKKWSQYCDHDFKLSVLGATYKVDVSGQKLNGTFGNPGKGKKSVDFHLICQIVDKDILWLDVRTGASYTGDIFPESGIWPGRMVVWLNCIKNGIDYTSIKKMFITSGKQQLIYTYLQKTG